MNKEKKGTPIINRFFGQLRDVMLLESPAPVKMRDSS